MIHLSKTWPAVLVLRPFTMVFNAKTPNNLFAFIKVRNGVKIAL